MTADRIDALATALAATWPLYAVAVGFLLLLLGGLCLPDIGKRALPESLIRPETQAEEARLHADADRAAELRKAAGE